MGPQPFGCGRRMLLADLKEQRSGFNGAATFRLRKAHDGFKKGMIMAASMGPQPFGCGRRAQPDQAGRPRQASMGPQPFGCGRRESRRRRPRR